MTGVKVDIKALLNEQQMAYSDKIAELNNQIKELQGMLMYERERREYTEKKLEDEVNTPKRKRRTKAEVEAEREGKEYNEYRSDGIKKKVKMDPVRSYTEFKNIQDYFLQNGKISYYVLWTVGTCMGLRVSDIVTLKWKNVLNDDMSFKERVKLYEQKTGKAQDCLITEAMRQAFTVLLNSKRWHVRSEGYIFPGQNHKDPLSPKSCYRLIREAAVAMNVRGNIGTHSMRETFANVILCLDNGTVDMNAITKVQGLLNHSDSRTTMRYLGLLNEMYDRARNTVSDFVLGKAVDKDGKPVDELVSALLAN